MPWPCSTARGTVPASQIAVHELCRLAEVVLPARAVGHQGTGPWPAVVRIHGRQTATEGKLNNAGMELKI